MGFLVSMITFLQKRWFLISLAIFISLGMISGISFSDAQFGQFQMFNQPRLVTAIVLFLMAFSLDSHHLKESFRFPFPVLWASSVCFIVIPLMAWGVMGLQLIPDFSLGLMIAGSVPCTMAAASVWTRKSKGNDAVSLLVTVTTNGLCFLVTPFWLNWATAQDVDLDAVAMFWRLMISALLPMLAGQLVRQIAGAARFATKHKTAIGVAAQSCILVLVFSAALRAGHELNGSAAHPGVAGIVLVWVCCMAIHLAAMGIGVLGAQWFGFSRRDLVAVAFASSQKTLPIGVVIATDPTMFGNPDLLGAGVGVPFAVFPMLMYHASQLFIDTFVADRFASTVPSDAAASDSGEISRDASR